METRRWLALSLVTVSALVSLSCAWFPGARRAQVARPTVAISEDAAKRLEEKAANLSTTQFRLELTEEEITSYLALHLDEAVPLASPQVYLLPGKIVLEGDITKPVRSHVTLTGTVSVVSGRVQTEIESAHLGGLSVPRILLASLSDRISEMVRQGQESIEIDSIELLAGRLVIVGRQLEP